MNDEFARNEFSDRQDETGTSIKENGFWPSLCICRGAVSNQCCSRRESNDGTMSLVKRRVSGVGIKTKVDAYCYASTKMVCVI